MKTILRRASSATLITTITLLASSHAMGNQYNVNRAWTDGFGNASLTGTVDLPIGSYAIMNGTPNPFTAVALTLTVNGTPFSLTHALTGVIKGTGQFLVEATPTTLTFDTANAGGSNPADLVFSDTTVLYANNFYGIGYNGHPGFEVAYTDAGNVIADLAFPIVFGIIPEPSTLALAGLGAALMIARRRR